MARLEREMAAVNVDYKELEASLWRRHARACCRLGYLERLLSKPSIERFLESRHPEFVENFRAIVQATSLDLPSGSGEPHEVMGPGPDTRRDRRRRRRGVRIKG
jgi:hypothetical protein